MLPKKSFWLWVFVFMVLFILGYVEGHAHETHLSDVGVLHKTRIEPCGTGTYVVESEELGCSVIYKDGDIITGFTLHIEPIDYDKDGDCDCPKGDVL
jgi:hypothetical protein